MQKRKSKVLDGVDKEILRILYEKKSLPSRQIARKVGLTASAVSPRLNNLCFMGYVRKRAGIVRRFERNSQKMEAPTFINWELDLK